MEGIDDNLENDKIILVKVNIYDNSNVFLIIFYSVFRQGC